MYCLCQEYRGRLYPQNKRLVESEEELDLDYCKEPCEMDVDVAISNSLGFGGHNACIVLQKYKEQ